MTRDTTLTLEEEREVDHNPGEGIKDEDLGHNLKVEIEKSLGQHLEKEENLGQHLEQEENLGQSLEKTENQRLEREKSLGHDLAGERSLGHNRERESLSQGHKREKSLRPDLVRERSLSHNRESESLSQGLDLEKERSLDQLHEETEEARGQGPEGETENLDQGLLVKIGRRPSPGLEAEREGLQIDRGIDRAQVTEEEVN